MQKKNEEKKPLTLHEKWELDSQEKNGGIGFDNSECTGELIEIQDLSKKKDK